ncbi:HmuY family protein [Parapedobacter tibetensis]|uniref:HmuY family protein n=1 Tax=Parapedobacter tibetensis TaxID=2972951 RepID=UPI00214D6B27|nr:HmuY family protein [Parapedobacter tibetensis]
METTYRNITSMAVGTLILMSTCYAQEIKTISNIDAAYKTAYFNLETGKEAADASGDWDIAFNRTTVLINGGSSGKGKTTAVLLKDVSFEGVTKEPDTGFKTDSDEEKAIPSGSGNGWYEYNMADHSINPISGRVFVIKTSSGKYVKLEILGYYNKSNYESANYSFRYSFL